MISLTRNVSYYNDKIPDDFLATSTAIVQHGLRYFLDEISKMNQNENPDDEE
ncbi:11477_t:CDS:1, partial [Scutellospora calospora]